MVAYWNVLWSLTDGNDLSKFLFYKRVTSTTCLVVGSPRELIVTVAKRDGHLVQDQPSTTTTANLEVLLLGSTEVTIAIESVEGSQRVLSSSEP